MDAIGRSGVYVAPGEENERLRARVTELEQQLSDDRLFAINETEVTRLRTAFAVRDGDARLLQNQRDAMADEAEALCRISIDGPYSKGLRSWVVTRAPREQNASALHAAQP